MKIQWIAFLCLIVFSFWVEGCQRACKDVNCLNGGECSNGQCRCTGRWSGSNCDTLCPIGLEGRYCATPSSVKFIRTWQATTSSTATGTVNHTLTITQGSFLQDLVISNFNGEGFTVHASILDYNSFEILPQNATGSYTGYVEGSGYLNGDNLAVNLTKEGVDYFANCNK